MKPLLFDTSIWVQFLRRVENESTTLLKSYLDHGFQAYICPTIYQEILQGCRNSKEHKELKDLLDSMLRLELENYILSSEAALIYINLRNAGYTIRKPNDCLIAYYSIHYKITLVHNDNDFDIIAKKYTLRYS